MGATIAVDNVSITLGGEPIFENLSFTVNAAELFGVIGPNGAGKSTLMKILTSTIKPNNGAIRIEEDADVASKRVSIGYVPQSRQFDADTPLRAWDFVSFGCARRLRPWLARGDRDRIKHALELTNCADFAHKAVGELSGGQRQRLYLAQALVQSPAVLLLDEPTSNLDPGSQELIIEVLDQVRREEHITVILVTHDIQLVGRYANRILYLARGHHAVGSADEILQTDVLSKLYGMPMQFHQEVGYVPV